MQLVEFLIGEECFPIYREITPGEEQMLAALLGRHFHFVLEEGEPMDQLLFDVLTGVGASSDFFFSPPKDAAVLGTFQLRDAEIPEPAPRRHRRRGRRYPTTH
jgi:hypothetical protein